MKIVPYSEWAPGLEWRGQPTQIPTPQPRLWLHHGAAGTSSISTARGYARFHMEKRGYLAVGYSFLIAEGLVLAGRGAGRQGAHTRGDNSESHAVCMVGRYEAALPSARDLNALVWLLDHGADRGWWPEAKLTGGHRDAPGANTSCPGTALWRHIPTINSRDQEDDDVYVVRRGQTGLRVQRAQVVIAAAGERAGMGNLLPRFGPDGDYGAETAAAVDSLAGRAKLPEDGSRGMDVLVLDYCRNWLSG